MRAYILVLTSPGQKTIKGKILNKLIIIKCKKNNLILFLFRTYAAMTGNAIGAEYHIQSWSGQGEFFYF